MTEDQFEAILLRFEALETSISINKKCIDSLKQDNEMIVSWIQGAKLGAKMIMNSGKLLNLLVKIGSAILLFFGLYAAVHEGKIPSINISGEN
jgi:hypothetical protein